MRAVACLLTAALLAGACGERGGYTPAACARPTPLSAMPRLPERLPMVAGSEVVKVEQKKGYLIVDSVSERSVNDLFDRVVAQVRAEGFEVVMVENEGFEAEVFFRRADRLAGAFRLREGPCPGLVTLGLLYDPLETKAGRASLRKTDERRRELREVEVSD